MVESTSNKQKCYHDRSVKIKSFIDNDKEE